jgi:RNA polymerase sigma-70 factor (ECF subfamily)
VAEGADERDVRDIRAVLAGDAERFRGLVDRHGPRVFDLARRLLRDAALAEDVTQQAFTNAWKALARFDLARPFRHWILRITTNLCRNAFASRAVRREVRGGWDDEDGPEPPAAPAPSPAPRHDAAEVRAAIERLPERYRLAVVLHHLHGLPLEEVAEIAEIPVATVKTHLFRGRALLKDMLAPPETSPGDAGTS